MSTAEMTEPEATANTSGLAEKLNWLRAGVLGANDGIVSVSATVVGVAAATAQVAPVLYAGVAAVVAGAISMAVGEYVSVSSAADTQRTIISTLGTRLKKSPERELATLQRVFEEQGASPATARQVARELSEHNAVSAHLKSRWHLDTDEVLNAWHAAIASAVAFVAGASLPLATILLAPLDYRIMVTVLAVLITLAITGFISAKVSESDSIRPVLRIMVGGSAALLVTWAVGSLVGGVVG